MSEYIYTDLPRYAKTTPRENFSDSVVKSGSVLLFSEDGEKLVAKLPDGTFKEIGGSGEYYRCASVDTSTKTWTGYKAVHEDGGYVFETDVTTGLTFMLKIPEVGNIYSEDALIQVASIYEKPSEDGLIFYAPLATQKATDEKGNVLSYTGTVEYTTIDNKACALITPGNLISSQIQALPEGTSPISLLLCIRYFENKYHTIATQGDKDGNIRGFINSYGDICMYIGASPTDSVVRQAQNTWGHYAYTFDGSAYKMYYNGEEKRTVSGYRTINSKLFVIGRNAIGNTASFYVADVMIYNRVLSAEEIASIYNNVKSW